MTCSAFRQALHAVANSVKAADAGWVVDAQRLRLGLSSGLSAVADELGAAEREHPDIAPSVAFLRGVLAELHGVVDSLAAGAVEQAVRQFEHAARQPLAVLEATHDLRELTP